MAAAILADRLAAIDLMSTAALRAEWARIFRTPAPAVSSDLLAREIAYHLQVKAHGGLTTATKQRIERLTRQLDRNGEVAAEREVVLKTGTRLARDWHGKTHHVLVLDDAFLFEERRYLSLTRIANTITGANWSGPRFFGLKRREKAFDAHREAQAHG